MTFDLRIITVGYGEWTLWVSLAFSTALAVLLGWRVGRRVSRVRQPWLRTLLGLAVGGALFFGMYVATAITLQTLFMLAHHGASMCTVLVGRVLVMPSVAVVAGGAAGWWASERTVDKSGRPTSG